MKVAGAPDPAARLLQKRAVAIALSLLLGAAPAWAEQLEVHGLVQLWATRALDDVLTSGSREVPPNTYYDLRSELATDTFSVRRAELALSGRVAGRVGFRVMVDPSIGTRSSNVLQDAILSFEIGYGFVFRAGQMKTIQTHEGIQSSARLVLVERGQLTRRFGDVRDRGLTLSWDRAGERSVHLSLGLFNGAGKADDTNRAKDVAFRAEWGIARGHHLGAYGLRGSTDQPHDRVALDLDGAGAPASHDVLRARDATSQAGAFYLIERDGFGAVLEALTGRLGRRFPSLGTSPGPARREHIDQRLLGLQATLHYSRGAHSMAARYDRLDYNAGRRWHTVHDPYRESAPGTPREADFAPVFTELSLGYTFAFDPAQPASANIKLSYVRRLGHFLIPPAGRAAPRNPASLVAAVQVSF